MAAIAVNQTMIKPYSSNSLAAIVAVSLIACYGCGPEQQVDENRAVVSGVVTFDGKPLPAGKMTFNSTTSPLATSISIKKEGRYQTDRVPIGNNLVSIETESLQFGSPHLYVKIPAKYADPGLSGLTVDVKPGANENVNFELQK